MSYERDNIRSLHAYTPGEQPTTGDVIKLNTNENPYPPCEAVMAAIRNVQADALRRYPSPNANQFRETAATIFGLAPTQVIATNGGDELLRLVITVFCNAGAEGDTSRRGIGVTEPTYSLYPVLANIHDTPVKSVPLNSDYSIPDDFADQMIAAGVGLVLIVNPHAPSGHVENAERLADIAAQLQGHAVLLIDEAYVDFAENDALSLLDATRGLDNVILLRTMSKGYSLAGLRFGYGLGHAPLIAALDKARDSYNTDALSQAAATAALENRDEASVTWQAVFDERKRVAEALSDRSFAVLPSQTNFILVTPPSNGPSNAGLSDVTLAADLHQFLKARHIFVRYFDHEGLRDKLRITIGSPKQNDALTDAIDAWLNP